MPPETERASVAAGRSAMDLHKLRIQPSVYLHKYCFLFYGDTSLKASTSLQPDAIYLIQIKGYFKILFIIVYKLSLKLFVDTSDISNLS